jgi:hypothetical protein
MNDLVPLRAKQARTLQLLEQLFREKPDGRVVEAGRRCATVNLITCSSGGTSP